jgi:hypothetical protein
MTKNEANKLLDRLREGHPMPVALTTQALYTTGDISKLFGKPLRFDGYEQRNNRPCQAHDQAAEVGFSYSQYLDKKTD